MNLDAFLEHVAQSPLRAHAEWFRRWHRPALAITAVSGEPRLGGSRLGGAPDLPIGTAWPRHRLGPYRFLLQIDLADLAPMADWPMPWRTLLPRAGLLSVFVADDPNGVVDPREEFLWNAGRDADYVVAFLAEPGARLEPVPPPREVEADAAQPIAFVPRIDLPTRYVVPDFPIDWRNEEDCDAYDALQDLVGRGDHLFGYPSNSTLAYDPVPAGHVPLLSVYTNEKARRWFWSGGDWLMVFVDPARVRAGQFPLAADMG